MNSYKFETIAIDKKARVNKVNINGKEFLTPIFMPVATRGSIKSLPLDYLQNSKILLANTYHLYLRPGLDVIKRSNGLHEFINWKNLILTDSGGFQGWSIPNKLDNSGINFKNIYDGSSFKMTPKLSMEIQNILNSDIAMILDNLVNIDASYENQKNAITTTFNWASEARNIHTNKNQSLFGIVQGGLSKELRGISAEQMISLDFDGYAIGGLAIGESSEDRIDIVKHTVDYLPKNKLRYVMGLGDIKGMIDLIELGIDMFDCVWPARLARHGKIINKSTFFNLKNAKYQNDINPLVQDCYCYTCKNYSKSYLRHLLINESTSSWFYLTLHNIVQTENIIKEIQESILNSNFDKYKENLINE